MMFHDYTIDELVDIYYRMPLVELMYKANELRQSLHPGKTVTWIIDRNVNITNVCIVQCKFCNFCRIAKNKDAYVTTIEQYKQKIEELFKFGGNQLLLQGGLHPDLGLDYYENLFRQLKETYPDLRLHALGPAEVVYLAKKENLPIENVLKRLIKAGLDSLPGAGAEILSNRIRKELSPAKCSADEWLNVMRIAHKLGMVTSATMMYGHIETIEERMLHLILLRDLQKEKPINSPGFLNFVIWPIQIKNTRIEKKYNIPPFSPSEYVRMLAISRLVLYNIPHIQPSWLTVGKDIAQLCLYAGADDMGSIMIEENVVSSAGSSKTTMTIEEMKKLIIEAGFIPVKRNQMFHIIE